MASQIYWKFTDDEAMNNIIGAIRNLFISFNQKLIYKSNWIEIRLAVIMHDESRRAVLNIFSMEIPENLPAGAGN